MRHAAASASAERTCPDAAETAAARRTADAEAEGEEAAAAAALRREATARCMIASDGYVGVRGVV
jgi:hypothetical protein